MGVIDKYVRDTLVVGVVASELVDAMLPVLLLATEEVDAKEELFSGWEGYGQVIEKTARLENALTSWRRRRYQRLSLTNEWPSWLPRRMLDCRR